MRARSLKIRQVFATNAQKTIEVELETGKGKVRSSVPMGTSVGKHEVKYLPVEEAINKFYLIRRHFTAEDFEKQEDVDMLIRIIDKTSDLREIGGNLALAISSAFLKAFALEEGQEVFEYLLSQRKESPMMPKPVCNVVGGWKEQRSDIQEFLLLPVHQKSFLDSMTKISHAYRNIGEGLASIDPTFVFAKNLESAWVTNLQLEEIMKILTKVANENLLKIGLDIAASQLWDKKNYYVYPSNRLLNKREQIDFVRNIAKKYPIIYIEDPFEEDDFVSFSILTHELQPKIIVGDDLYSSNITRLKQGVEFKATNGIIIKPNQVGTITDVMKTVDFAKKNKIVTIVSHRSSETEDTLICHLAVGLGCDYIKLGIAGERTVKINEMIRIEEKLNEQSRLN
jgi:enolase